MEEKPKYTQAYLDYYKSPTWAKKRKAALKRAGYRCQYCGKKGGVLQVHHLTYARFGGNEKPRDLKVACLTCHQIADNERRYNAGLHTYLIKKYGERWQDFISIQQARMEFDKWLESKKHSG